MSTNPVQLQDENSAKKLISELEEAREFCWISLPPNAFFKYMISNINEWYMIVTRTRLVINRAYYRDTDFTLPKSLHIARPCWIGLGITTDGKLNGSVYALKDDGTAFLHPNVSESGILCNGGLAIPHIKLTDLSSNKLEDLFTLAKLTLRVCNFDSAYTTWRRSSSFRRILDYVREHYVMEQ